MTAVHDLKLTYEDYLHFPEDGKRHELIEGEHVVTPAPSPRHQFVLSNLHRLLSAFVHAHGLGRVVAAPFDVVLSSTDVVQPDLAYLSRETLARITEANLRGAPDLVVEVLSPTTRGRDEVTKRHLYAKYGVREYWLVDPQLETVRVFREQPGGLELAQELAAERREALTTPLLPLLSVPLREVFE